LGVKPATRDEKFTASFEVPYQPGELKAVGYRGDQLVAETSLHTASAAASLRLTPDRARLRAGAGDLCYVTVEIVDGEGMLHPAADRPVFFTVQGAGSLAAVGSANPVSLESYRGNQRSTFRGRALVVIRSQGQPGEIRLRAQADGLAPAELCLTAG
jgi:beta-galactosidase